MNWFARIRKQQEEAAAKIAAAAKASAEAAARAGQTNASKGARPAVGQVVSVASSPTQLTIQALFARYSRMISQMGWVIQSAIIYGNTKSFDMYQKQISKLMKDIETKMALLRSKDFKHEFGMMKGRLKKVGQFIQKIESQKTNV